MSMNNNPYKDIEDGNDQGQSTEFFEGLVDKFSHNPLVSLLRRKILLRKTLMFYALVIPIVLLIVGGLNSPTRVTYSQEQLATDKEFSNETGSVKIVSQTYSKKNGIMIFEFETTDATSSISKGINANNLNWELYTPPGVNADRTQMEVIPLTDNKIDVVVRNVPENYGVMVVRVANTTVPNGDIDVSIKDYQEHKDNPEEKNEEEEAGNYVDFYITPQSGQLKHKKIEDLSRESFTLQIFNDELTFQKEQVKTIEEGIAKLNSSIQEDMTTLEQLGRESKYLVGEELTKNLDALEVIQRDITRKKRMVNTAEQNILTLNTIIKNLESSIKQVEDGSYEFNSPVRSIKKDIQ